MTSRRTLALRDFLRQREPDLLVEPESMLVPAGVYSFGRGLFVRAPITGADTKYTKYTTLRRGDLVYSKLKAWERAFGIVEDLGVGAVVSQEFPVFDVDESLVCGAYLSYLVRSEPFAREVAANASGLGARRDRVHPDSILGIEPPVPSVDEQERVAKWLADVESRTTRLTGTLAPAERLEDALREAIAKSYAVDVEEVRLDELLTERPADVELEPSSSFSPVGVYSFGKGLFPRPAMAGTDTSYRTMTTIQPGDFVYSKLMAWEGAVAVSSEREAGLLATPEFPVFALDQDRLSPGYFGTLLRTTSFGEQLRSLSTGTNNTRRRRVHPSVMLQIEIPLPPMGVQEQIAGIARRLKQREVGRHLIKTHASALFDSALNQVFGSLN